MSEVRYRDIDKLTINEVDALRKVVLQLEWKLDSIKANRGGMVLKAWEQKLLTAAKEALK